MEKSHGRTHPRTSLRRRCTGGVLAHLHGLTIAALVVFFTAGVSLAQAPGLWPGQPAAQGWVQFPNGAWGAITGAQSGSPQVSWYDGSQTRTSTYSPNNFRNPANTNYAPPANTNGAPSGLSAPRFQQWAAWAGLSAARLALPLAIIYPDQLGDGSPNGGTYQSCQTQTGCAGGWHFMDLPCIATWNTNYLTVDHALYPSRQQNGSYCPMSQYPDASPTQPFTYFNGTGSWPSYAEALGLEIPDPLTPEQIEELEENAGPLTYPPGAPQPFHSPGFVAPDVWEPVPFPSEMPTPLPAEVMNPNGYPPDGDGVRTAPVEFPTPTPWPDPATNPGTWPGDHPNPGTAPDPFTAPDPGTSPGTDPGTAPVNVTVNFPDTLDARIVDTEIQVQPEGADPGIDGATVDVSGFLDFGSGWLPRDCPAFDVQVAGQTLSFGHANFCNFLSILGGLMMAMSAVVALRYGLGGM